MIKLRKFSPKDLDQILTISKASFAEPWPKKEFEKLQNSDGFIVAEENDEIAGFAVAKISGNQGFLKLVAVNQNYRGKGIGKGLMENIFNYFKEKGVKEIMAHSRLYNEVGCAFLKSFGFEIAETIKNYYGNGEDAYSMRKEL